MNGISSFLGTTVSKQNRAQKGRGRGVSQRERGGRGDPVGGYKLLMRYESIRRVYGYNRQLGEFESLSQPLPQKRVFPKSLGCSHHAM